MKLHYPIFPILAATLLFTACGGSDDPEPYRPQLPATKGSPVVSISHHGSTSTCYDWNFTYNNGRLTSATGKRQLGDNATSSNYSYTSTLSYGVSSVSITNSNGSTVNVTLNTSGYISRMTEDRNTYTFSYNAEGRLSAWKKEMVVNSFGEADRYITSGTITYSNGNFASIVYTSPDNTTSETITFTPSSSVNYNGILPETVSTELGILGFEHLYYAGLLGRPTTNLVESLTVSGSKDNSTDYTVNFKYSMRGNDVTLCNYETPNGVASVNYSY